MGNKGRRSCRSRAGMQKKTRFGGTGCTITRQQFDFRRDAAILSSVVDVQG
jgi:hypothetical protein